MNNIPMPNSVVSVTTKHRNINYFSSDEFVYKVREGKVVNSPKWVPANCFCMETDNPDFPLSVINMSYVSDIKIVSGNASSVRKFKVDGSKGSHIVMLSGKQLSCDCIGFKYRSKCKHVEAVRKKL